MEPRKKVPLSTLLEGRGGSDLSEMSDNSVGQDGEFGLFSAIPNCYLDFQSRTRRMGKSPMLA
jgi:hypothetical protein